MLSYLHCFSDKHRFLFVQALQVQQQTNNHNYTEHPGEYENMMEDEESDEEENSSNRNGRGKQRTDCLDRPQPSRSPSRCRTSYEWVCFSSWRESYHSYNERSQYKTKTRSTSFGCDCLKIEMLFARFRHWKMNWVQFKTRRKWLITIGCINKTSPQVETNTKHWKWFDRAIRRNVSMNSNRCKNGKTNRKTSDSHSFLSSRWSFHEVCESVFLLFCSLSLSLSLILSLIVGCGSVHTCTQLFSFHVFSILSKAISNNHCVLLLSFRPKPVVFYPFDCINWPSSFLSIVFFLFLSHGEHSLNCKLCCIYSRRNNRRRRILSLSFLQSMLVCVCLCLSVVRKKTKTEKHFHHFCSCLLVD